MSDETRFRTVMGHFVTGVTVVTSRLEDGSPCGLTANSVASVSLDPPLILVCIARSASTLVQIRRLGTFGVNVLGSEAGEAALHFSSGVREERFSGRPFGEARTGSPVLDDALAWLDCRVHAIHEGGDHVIVVGEVLACGATEGEPLIFFRGRLRGLEEGDGG